MARGETEEPPHRGGIDGPGSGRRGGWWSVSAPAPDAEDAVQIDARGFHSSDQHDRHGLRSVAG